MHARRYERRCGSKGNSTVLSQSATSPARQTETTAVFSCAQALEVDGRSLLVFGVLEVLEVLQSGARHSRLPNGGHTQESC